MQSYEEFQAEWGEQYESMMSAREKLMKAVFDTKPYQPALYADARDVFTELQENFLQRRRASFDVWLRRKYHPVKAVALGFTIGSLVAGVLVGFTYLCVYLKWI
jgi:hypothetical protein